MKMRDSEIRRCPVCDLALDPSHPTCPNFWCARNDRGFDAVWAVGEHRGRLRRAIAGLKYRGEWWRAPWLGALLVDFLLEEAPSFDDIDLIVGTPGNVGRARPVDHVTQILAHAHPVIGDLWAMDLASPVLIKQWETRPMVGTSSAAVRRLWAAGELRAALVVARPADVRGCRVLAVDDVFTDGSTLREVALALRTAGAIAVSGLVLARQPLRPTVAKPPPKPPSEAHPSAPDSL